MDDIIIDIASMQSKAAQLHTLSDKIYTVAEKMAVIKQQLTTVWQDEAFQKFDADFASVINRLLGLQETVISMSKVCDTACEEYQKAENNIMLII